MHSTTTTLSALLAAFLPATFAAPSAEPISPLHIRNNIAKVGFGQQLQNGDQANHWVVWVEGESACPHAIDLGPMTSNPCNKPFTLPGSSTAVILSDCDGNSPKTLREPDNNNGFITTCDAASDKINCHGDKHDIVKHGKCVA
ncbi:hypothetical protein HD806DRAFT_493504 [Xylariaceae sp. AK1471]|nr:hypothetical protein HD806DRAFT_493504 [Xylariaceae sp. AK1471]